MERLILSESDLASPKKLDILKAELKALILNKGVKWGEGIKGKEFYKMNFDTKEVLLNPRGAFITALLFKDKLRKFEADYVAGMTLASHLIASGLIFMDSFADNKLHGLLIRKEPKNHNMCKQIEGALNSNSRVVIVDDALHAANFSIRSIELLEKSGCGIQGVEVLINYQKEEDKLLRERGYQVDQIFTLEELGLKPLTKPKLENMFKLLWKYGPVNLSDYTAPKSTPCMDENRVYVGSDQGKMLAFDFDGKLLWEFKTDYHEHGVHSSPILIDDKVIFSAYDGNVYSIDSEDGKSSWKSKISDWIGSSPVYDPETKLLYIGLEHNPKTGSLAALDLKGNLVWDFLASDYVPGKPETARNKDIVVVGCNDSCIYACSKRNGDLLWKFAANGEVKGSPTIDNEKNKVYAASFDGNLYCLNLLNGDLIWKRKLGTKLFNKPLVYGSKVIIGSYSNQVACLNKENGEIEWYFMTGDSILSSPFYDNGIIYIGSYDKHIYAIDLNDGKPLWRFKTDGIITSSPRIKNGKLFVSSNDSYLYCFERQ